MPMPFRPLAGGLFALALLASGCDAGLSPDNAANGSAASALAGPDAAAQAEAATLAGRYIVVLAETPAKANARARADLDAVIAEARSNGAEVAHRYEHALTGFAARLSPEAASELRADPRVAYVAADAMAHAVGTQTGATWGLDRINQRNLPLNNTYTWQTSGAGVTVYVLDTGVRITHNDFGGRASYGYDFIDNDVTADDCYNHGTHVSGTIAGTTWGVAKDAEIVSVRVLGCDGSGPWSVVIAGIDWVTANHVAPAVANMSLGGGSFPAADAAVTNSIAAGVSYSIAAGNSYNANACNFSPAATPNAMTLGATTRSDRRASFSNSGPCIDFFAPGDGITSASNSSNTSTAVFSGTSMAAPHAAGVAAMYLEAFPSAAPLAVRNALFNATTKNKITSANSTNNHLLYNSRR